MRGHPPNPQPVQRKALGTLRSPGFSSALIIIQLFDIFLFKLTTELR